MYNEYALKGRVRNDKRIGNWQDRRDRINPILKEKFELACEQTSRYFEERKQAWGSRTNENAEVWNAFSDTYLRPALKRESELRLMYWCIHKTVTNEGDFLLCQDCGAVDYGHGWDCVS